MVVKTSVTIPIQVIQVCTKTALFICLMGDVI